VADVMKPSEQRNYAEFVFLSAVLRKVQVFWDVTPCRTLNSDRRFEGRNAFIFWVKQREKM
jgi:hypothetical protein